MKVTKRSIISKVEHTREINCTQNELMRHANGEFAQDIWPHLSKEDREFLISGATPEEWQETFSE